MIPGGLRGALIDARGEGDCTTTAERVRKHGGRFFFSFFDQHWELCARIMLPLAIKVCIISLSLD